MKELGYNDAEIKESMDLGVIVGLKLIKK